MVRNRRVRADPFLFVLSAVVAYHPVRLLPSFRNRDPELISFLFTLSVIIQAGLTLPDELTALTVPTLIAVGDVRLFLLLSVCLLRMLTSIFSSSSAVQKDAFMSTSQIDEAIKIFNERKEKNASKGLEIKVYPNVRLSSPRLDPRFSSFSFFTPSLSPRRSKRASDGLDVDADSCFPSFSFSFEPHPGRSWIRSSRRSDRRGGEEAEGGGIQGCDQLPFEGARLMLSTSRSRRFLGFVILSFRSYSFMTFLGFRC